MDNLREDIATAIVTGYELRGIAFNDPDHDTMHAVDYLLTQFDVRRREPAATVEDI